MVLLAYFQHCPAFLLRFFFYKFKANARFDLVNSISSVEKNISVHFSPLGLTKMGVARELRCSEEKLHSEIYSHA